MLYTAPREMVEGGRGAAQGLGIGLCAFGGAYGPLATAHPNHLWAERVLVVSTEPPEDLSCLTTLGGGGRAMHGMSEPRQPLM